jgi:hypothetical protein
MADKELGGLLDKLGKKGAPAAAKPGDAWVAKYNEHKQKVIRPTLEELGKEVRSHEHDFNIVDIPFKRHENNPVPTEGLIRIDLYLNDERTRTRIGQDRRPHLAFTTKHKSEMVEVTICDITSRGGVVSTIGDFPIEKIDAAFVKDKFVALFKRLLSTQGGKG